MWEEILMGEAKRRGTYEQRRAKAIEREADKPKPITYESKLTPQEKSFLTQLFIMAGMSMSGLKGDIWRY